MNNCDKFIVQNSMNLNGDVYISGSKNASLPIMAAAFLIDGKCVIGNVPVLSDVIVMCDLLRSLGAEVQLGDSLVISTDNVFFAEPSFESTKSIRASFLLAGALLGRFGKARLPFPGGCSIGVRPVDLHLKGFSLLGASYTLEHGIVDIRAERLKGADICLDLPSVGATENIILAAVKAEGETVISNCALEPEIADLISFLNKCGAKITGAGTDTIKITGVKTLHPCKHNVIPDRIEAGTFMLAAAASCGNVCVKNVVTEHLKSVISKLREINTDVEEGADFVTVSAKKRLKNTDIKTMPFPGFPTDMQAQFMSLMSVCEGSGIINETVFENRFMHVCELNRMGADIRVDGRNAFVRGVSRLTGTKVKATDLRAGAALVISALCAEGTTEIGDIHYIDRGYEKFDEKLKKLGAKIYRV